MSAIPYLGNDIVQLLWGGFSVNNATLNRFFSLHYLLPFVLAAFAIVHMITLHENGSGNPIGNTGNSDRIPMAPYFLFKDLITIFAFFIALSVFIFYFPNILGHSDNYIEANPMSTPASIVPEWYLLPFYAILRSIPNKLLGVIAMLASILVLAFMPLLDQSQTRSNGMKPISKLLFWIFAVDFLLLMFLGSQHVEEPYISIGQLATAYYFAHFFLLVPFSSTIQDALAMFSLKK